jgi:regulation of enolase protein 1 (concanavalin A-like superfamily)
VAGQSTDHILCHLRKFWTILGIVYIHMNYNYVVTNTPKIMTQMQWYNEPSIWNEQAEIVDVNAGANTDFWQKTHYNFRRDNGNFYYQKVKDNFTAEVKVIGQYQALYDQAGLMIRENENTWLKCGIEYVEGVQNVSAVVTRDYSDWSVVPLSQAPVALWLRVQRRSETVEVQYSLDGDNYQMLRLAYLTDAETVQVGLMCASPQGEGFSVTFESFKITQP